MGDSPIAGVRQLLTQGQGPTPLGNGLGKVALVSEQAGQGDEHLGFHSRILLKNC